MKFIQDTTSNLKDFPKIGKNNIKNFAKIMKSNILKKKEKSVFIRKKSTFINKKRVFNKKLIIQTILV